MLLKRLIGVIAVYNGWAVQSIGYRRMLPVGKPECLAENLDRWGADEIMILDFGRSRQKLGPDLDLIRRLAALGLSTPLTYGGGITSVDDAKAAIQAGVERICIDSLMHDNPGLVPSLTDRVGAQAIVAAFPLARSGDALQWYDHRRRTEVQLHDDALKPLLNGEISEALVVDWRHEGVKNGFDPVLLEHFAARLRHVPLLAYGGISEPEQIRPLLGNAAVAAVCVGNFLNYREHAVQELKRAVVDAPLRPPVFAKEAL